MPSSSLVMFFPLNGPKRTAFRLSKAPSLNPGSDSHMHPLVVCDQIFETAPESPKHKLTSGFHRKCYQCLRGHSLALSIFGHLVCHYLNFPIYVIRGFTQTPSTNKTA